MIFKSLQLRGSARLVSASDGSWIMKKGDVGLGVRLVQQALVDLGYPMPKTMAAYGTVDGEYGTETKAKVRKFQIDEKLSNDGRIGPQTLGRIDDLLFERKIPSKTLPPLPGGAPGNWTDESGDSRQTIIEILTVNNPLANMAAWGFRYLNKDLNESWDATIAGFQYHRVAEAIIDGRIGIEVMPGIRHAALYVTRHPKAIHIKNFRLSHAVSSNTFVLSRPMTKTLNDRLMIIHEATHAVCDWQKIGQISAQFAEIIAIVAEAIYCRKLTGAPKSGAKAYLHADEIAKLIITGKSLSDANFSNLMRDLAFAVSADPDYGSLTWSEFNFDGLVRVAEDEDI